MPRQTWVVIGHVAGLPSSAALMTRALDVLELIHVLIARETAQFLMRER